MLYIVLTKTGTKEIFFDYESAIIFYSTSGGITLTTQHATDYYNENIA